MAYLSNKTVSVLVVMEGERRELPFIERFVQLYRINAKLYIFHTNIYTLYQAMKEIDFAGDVRDVLISLPNMKDQDLQTLKNTKFAYTYLVFDCEAHHTRYSEKSFSIDDVAPKNMDQLLEMAKYFTDETDPSKGKLYINYPMMESYRDCDSFFEDKYQSTRVCIDDIKNYKELTGQTKIANHNIKDFTKEDFNSLLRMNIYKLNFMLNNTWGALTYKDYRILSEQAKIVAYERNLITSERCIDVLNTTLFLLVDYFGNQRRFYDGIMQLLEG